MENNEQDPVKLKPRYPFSAKWGLIVASLRGLPLAVANDGKFFNCGEVEEVLEDVERSRKLAESVIELMKTEKADLTATLAETTKSLAEAIDRGETLRKENEILYASIESMRSSIQVTVKTDYKGPLNLKNFSDVVDGCMDAGEAWNIYAAHIAEEFQKFATRCSDTVGETILKLYTEKEQWEQKNLNVQR